MERLEVIITLEKGIDKQHPSTLFKEYDPHFTKLKRQLLLPINLCLSVSWIVESTSP